MNSIDGRVLAEKIHILYPQIKFVFFTGLTITEKDLPLSISDSVLGILYKPFNEIQFENIIKKSREEKNILRVNYSILHNQSQRRAAPIHPFF